MVKSRRVPDHYARKAKNEGHAARSIYKLQEIDARWKILKPGQRVLDLGCSPGSWMQYAAKQVGSKGYVLGVDLKSVDIALPAHAETRVGDVFLLTDLENFDVVLSDMAPKTMGDHATDAARSAALVEQAMALSDRCLRPGGSIVLKLLEGRDLPTLVKNLRLHYARVELFRPEATRKQSTEIFLVGLQKNG
jgi:23S rRNA (uridine2552-2'-O)-methyltransferase